MGSSSVKERKGKEGEMEKETGVHISACAQSIYHLGLYRRLSWLLGSRERELLVCYQEEWSKVNLIQPCSIFCHVPCWAGCQGLDALKCRESKNSRRVWLKLENSLTTMRALFSPFECSLFGLPRRISRMIRRKLSRARGGWFRSLIRFFSFPNPIFCSICSFSLSRLPILDERNIFSL